MTRIGGLLGGAVLLAALAPPAAAEFFDCTADWAAKAIDPKAPFTCVVLATDETPLRAGTTEFRIVTDLTSDTKLLAPWVELSRQTIKENSAAWSQYYEFDLRPITVVLFDPNDPFIPVKEVLGRQKLVADQCVLLLNTKDLTEGGADPVVLFQRTLAHELAHCLQRTMWPGAMDADGNKWWREGAADMLSAVLYPLTPDDIVLQGQFDAQSAAVPLTRMSYESATFFHWLWGKDPVLVFKLMAAMPSEAGEAAQRAALLAFFQDEAFEATGQLGLDRFAQDYLDGNVRDPHGAVIAAPDLGPALIFDQTRSATFNAEPFTVQRALVGFIGDFALPTFDAFGPIWARPADGDWAELPLFIDQESCEQPKMYKVGRFVTADFDHGFRLDANQTETCELCRVTQDQDACLVGQWSVDLPALTEELRRRVKGLSGVGTISGGITFDLRQDGNFTVSYDQVFIGGLIGKPEDDVAPAWWLQIGGQDGGTWSAADGVLTFCVHEPGSQVVSTVALSETQQFVTDHSGYAQSGVYSYACGQTTLLNYSGPLVMPSGYEPRWTLNKLK